MAGRCSASAASAAVWLLLLLLLTVRDALQQETTNCACACSSRVGRMFTCGQQVDCCAKPCQPQDRVDGAQLQADAALTQQAVAAGRAAAQACANETLQRDAALESARPVRRGTPEYHQVRTLQPTGVAAFERSVADRCLATRVAESLADAYNVTRRDVGVRLLELRVNSTGPNPWEVPSCNASARYRTFDGSCNNLQFPAWGQAGSQFTRLLCPRYNDGLYEPPRARDGGELPSARLLRKTLIPNAPHKWVDSHVLTLLVMQWGQLVAHDSALTPLYLGANGLGVMCCAEDPTTRSRRAPLPPNETPSSCLAVDGPGRYCLSVPRNNASFVSTRGFLGPGEQDGAINNYLDASFVYGNSIAIADSLRTFVGGLLSTSGNNWMPRSDNASVECDPRNGSDVCFVAGDGRVNQNSQLTSLQVIMLREHNRVARELAAINPQWNDERLYQETRRIVIAEYQHITYERLVPIYIGFVTARRFGLTSDQFCRYDSEGYNPSVDATTLNEFATASYRVFHGIAQTNLKLYDRANGCPVGKLRLQDWMDTPVAVIDPPGRLDQLLLGLSTQPMQKPHRFITDALGDYMFERDDNPGLDLAAFDIQRGRDHALPPYCEYRRKLGGRCCRFWSDLADRLSSDVIQKLRTVYRDPRDVELYVGLFLEEPQGFAITGPTAASINLEQFWRWKYGDRFFYDFQGQIGSFSLPQLCELKKATVSRLMCDNGDNITSIQPDAFFLPNIFNHPVECEQIPRVNLSLWKE